LCELANLVRVDAVFFLFHARLRKLTAALLCADDQHAKLLGLCGVRELAHAREELLVWIRYAAIAADLRVSPLCDERSTHEQRDEQNNEHSNND
jgi:hypothetical protein